MTSSFQSYKKQVAGMRGTVVDGAKKTIFIYSPDLNFCFSLSMLFQDRYNVVTTTNPGMLESSVGEYSADLVIIDAIPSDALVHRLEELKARQKALPIIMLYVFSPKTMVLEGAMRRHVDAVFYKPFETDAMSKRISELLPPGRG